MQANWQNQPIKTRSWGLVKVTSFPVKSRFGDPLKSRSGDPLKSRG